MANLKVYRPNVPVPVNAKLHEETNEVAVTVTLAGKNNVSCEPWIWGTSVIESDGKLSTEILRAREKGILAKTESMFKLTSTVLQHAVATASW
jgi:hypothetical protein